jgi:hypothetical protein
MTQDTLYVFPVTFQVIVRVHDIDEAAAEAHRNSMNNPALAADPSTAERLERDRRLLAAVRARPDLLLRRAKSEAVILIDYLSADDESVDDLRRAQISDAEFIEAVADGLPPADVEHYRELCADDAFDDNAGFFRDAFTITHRAYTIGDPTVSEED